MNHVFDSITDREQFDAAFANVFSLDDRRELDAIKGHLASLCATLRITEGTLLLAAQIVQNAKHAGASEVDAFAAGVRHAKRRHEEAVAAAWDNYQDALRSKREQDAVELAFSDSPEVA